MEASKFRAGLLIFASVLLVFLIVDYSSSNNPLSSLAGIRVDAGSDIHIAYQGVHSESSVFNPEYDLDAPTPKLESKAEPMGVNDIQTALAGLESKDLTNARVNRHAELASQKDDIFDPSKDPDAPKPRLSSLQRKELAETARANQMKAQLKIEAQLAMLTQRQQIRKHHEVVKSGKEKGNSKPETKQTKLSAHVLYPKSIVKPSFRSISDEVRDSLDKGLDPSKIITKELQSEMQVSYVIYL